MIKKVLVLFFSSLTLMGMAQYELTPPMETLMTTGSSSQWNQTSDAYGDFHDGNRGRYAVAYVDYQHPIHGGEHVKYYDGSGALLATSLTKYSTLRDNSMKVRFSAADDVFYILYSEKLQNSTARGVYIKKFTYIDGSTTLLESNALYLGRDYGMNDFEVMDKNGSGFVAVVMYTSSGSLILRTLDLSIMSPFYNNIVQTQVIESYTKSPFGAHLDSDGQSKLVLAYNTGTVSNSRVNIKKFKFLNPIFVEEFSHDSNGQVMGKSYEHSVALRSNGDILFGNTAGPLATTWSLVNIDVQNNVRSTVGTHGASGYGGPGVVTSQNGSYYVVDLASNVSAGKYSIYQYNEHDELDYEYPLSSQISGTNYSLRVQGCKFMITGNNYGSDPGTSYHQFFRCFNDCTSGPVADGVFVNPVSNVMLNSFYGPIQVSRFCMLKDVIFDGSTSKCEDRVFVAIHEFDLVDWESDQLLYSGIMSYNTMPEDLAINNFLSPPTNYNKVYMLHIDVSAGVYGPANADNGYYFFQVGHCNSVKPIKKSMQTSELADVAINVFPNPSGGEFNILTSMKGEAEYTVRNLQGKMVANGSFVSEVKLDLTNLPKGMYTIQLTNGQQNAIEKVIIK